MRRLRRRLPRGGAPVGVGWEKNGSRTLCGLPGWALADQAALAVRTALGALVALATLGDLASLAQPTLGPARASALTICIPTAPNMVARG